MAEPSWQSGPSFSLSIKCTRCLPRGPQCIQVNMMISSNVCVFSPLFSLSALWMPDRVSTWFSPLFFLSALWMPFQESTRRRKHVCIYYRGQHHRPQPSPASQNSENPSALYTKFDAGSFRESVVVLAQHLRPRPFDSWMICNTFACRKPTGTKQTNLSTHAASDAIRFTQRANCSNAATELVFTQTPPI